MTGAAPAGAPGGDVRRVRGDAPPDTREEETWPTGM